MNSVNTKIVSTILLVVLMAGTAAAQPSDIPGGGLTPDSIFYGLDQFSESMELAVASAPIIGSEELQSKVRANHAAERLAEAQLLADKNRTDKVEELMEKYREGMNRSFENAGKANRSELSERLRNVSKNQVKVLEEVKQKVPEPARKGIQNAIDNNRNLEKKLDRPKRPDIPGKKPDNPVKRPEDVPGKQPGQKPEPPKISPPETPVNKTSPEPRNTRENTTGEKPNASSIRPDKPVENNLSREIDPEENKTDRSKEPSDGEKDVGETDDTDEQVENLEENTVETDDSVLP